MISVMRNCMYVIYDLKKGKSERYRLTSICMYEIYNKLAMKLICFNFMLY